MAAHRTTTATNVDRRKRLFREHARAIYRLKLQLRNVDCSETQFAREVAESFGCSRQTVQGIWRGQIHAKHTKDLW